MRKTIDEETMRTLENIAMDSDPVLAARGDIKTRHNDGEDFPAVSVWGLRNMLEQAYLLGFQRGEEAGRADAHRGVLAP